MNKIDWTTKTRSEGKKNPRAINPKARFTKRFLWQYRCNFLCDALARTHARPLHAMRLRGGNQPSAPRQPHHERAQESHATLLSRLPSGGRHHAVDLLLSFERLSIFKASSYYAHIRLHYHRAPSPRNIVFPDRDMWCVSTTVIRIIIRKMNGWWEKECSGILKSMKNNSRAQITYI